MTICNADPKQKVLQLFLCLAFIAWAQGMTDQKCDEYDRACEASLDANHPETPPTPGQMPIQAQVNIIARSTATSGFDFVASYGELQDLIEEKGAASTASRTQRLSVILFYTFWSRNLLTVPMPLILFPSGAMARNMHVIEMKAVLTPQKQKALDRVDLHETTVARCSGRRCYAVRDAFSGCVADHH
jgi:hypothetical protein